MTGDLAAYGGLFAAALVAATILPAQSELLLAALLNAGEQSPVLLVTFASLGNVLGSIVNWGLGRFLIHLRHRRWFPRSRRSMTGRSAGSTGMACGRFCWRGFP